MLGPDFCCVTEVDRSPLMYATYCPLLSKRHMASCLTEAMRGNRRDAAHYRGVRCYFEVNIATFGATTKTGGEFESNLKQHVFQLN